MSRDTIIVGICMFITGIFVGVYLSGVLFLRDVSELVGGHPPASDTAEKSDLKVRAVAKQYSWHFHYPGADGIFGATKVESMTEDNPLGLEMSDLASADDIHTTELVLPCDRYLELMVTSADVIHNLTIFDGRVNQDAIPGRDIPFHILTPSTHQTGRVTCGQYCGEGHKDHHASYRCLPEAEFRSWLSEQQSLAQKEK